MNSDRGSPGSVISTKFGSIACAVCWRWAFWPTCESDGPQILAVEEHGRIGHVVEAVDGRLQLEQHLGVPDVLAQVRRHRRRVAEQGGKHAAIGRDDRVFGIEDIKRRGAVVGVDDALTLFRM